MDLYQHDGSKSYRIVLRGELSGPWVQELESVWTTAKSILGGKTLLVDASGMTRADTSGIALLRRMEQSGAQIRPMLFCEYSNAALTADCKKGTINRFLSRLWRSSGPGHGM